MLSRNLFTFPPPLLFHEHLYYFILLYPLCHTQTCATHVQFSFYQLSHHVSTLHSSVSTVTRLQAGLLGFSCCRSRDLLFTSICSWVLGPSQPCVRGVWGAQQPRHGLQLDTLHSSHTNNQNEYSCTSTHPWYGTYLSRKQLYFNFTIMSTYIINKQFQNFQNVIWTLAF